MEIFNFSSLVYWFANVPLNETGFEAFSLKNSSIIPSMASFEPNTNARTPKMMMNTFLIIIQLNLPKPLSQNVTNSIATCHTKKHRFFKIIYLQVFIE